MGTRQRTLSRYVPISVRAGDKMKDSLIKTSTSRLVTSIGGGGSVELTIFIAPSYCRIKKVTVTPSVAVTMDDTNYYTLNVKNVTASTTLLASHKSLVSFGSFGGVYKVELIPDQNFYINNNAVLTLEIIKVASPPTFDRPIITVEYEPAVA